MSKILVEHQIKVLPQFLLSGFQPKWFSCPGGVGVLLAAIYSELASIRMGCSFWALEVEIISCVPYFMNKAKSGTQKIIPAPAPQEPNLIRQIDSLVFRLHYVPRPFS